MFSLIGLRGFAGDGAKVLVEAGEIGEAAFEAKLFDADSVVEQEFAGVADANLGEELGIGLAGAGFKVAAKRVGDEAGDGGDVAEIDLPGEIPKGIVVDRVDPVVLRFGEIGAEADGGEEMEAVGGGECGQAIDQCGDPADPVGEADLFDVRGDLFFLMGISGLGCGGLLVVSASWVTVLKLALFTRNCGNLGHETTIPADLPGPDCLRVPGPVVLTAG